VCALYARPSLPNSRLANHSPSYCPTPVTGYHAHHELQHANSVHSYSNPHTSHAYVCQGPLRRYRSCWPTSIGCSLLGYHNSTLAAHDVCRHASTAFHCRTGKSDRICDVQHSCAGLGRPVLDGTCVTPLPAFQKLLGSAWCAIACRHSISPQKQPHSTAYVMPSICANTHSMWAWWHL
jgi:hypothetical protein